jgi:FtsZ-binding cell division protein ZapB
MLTWLIEHTLLLLPTWFWFVVSGVGAVLYFFSGFIQAIPFAQARLAGYSIKYIGLALLLGGVYLTGGAGVTALWKAESEELKAKVAVSEQQSKDANTKLDDTLKEKNKVIKEVQIVIKERIKEVEKKIDAQCVVAPEAISILNDAAKNIKGTVTVGSDK